MDGLSVEKFTAREGSFYPPSTPGLEIRLEDAVTPRFPYLPGMAYRLEDTASGLGVPALAYEQVTFCRQLAQVRFSHSYLQYLAP